LRFKCAIWVLVFSGLSLGICGQVISADDGGEVELFPSYVITDINEEVTVDGVLDEPFWSQVEVISEFRQFRPYKDQPPILPTEAMFAKDEENLYIAIICYGDRDKLVKTVTQRDAMLNYDDCIDVFLDTFNDNRTSYDLMVNALNTQFDGILSQDGDYGDNSWDGVWESGVEICEDRYVVEMAIPFRILRYGDNDVWGLQIMREAQETSELTYWAGDGSNTNRVSQCGDLSGMTNLPKASPLDIIPFGLVRAENTIDPDTGELTGHEFDGTAGLDAEVRIGTYMTINATLNPDYAQIESDPEQINLSPEELEFSEKRPFFQEMLENFSTPLYLLYTRRLTDILVGGKMVATVGKRSRLAVMDMQLQDSDPNFPESNFFASRYEQDLWGKGFIGFEFLNRQGGGDDDSYNRVGAIDGRWNVIENLSLYSQVARSKTYPLPETLMPGEGEWSTAVGGVYNGHNLYLDFGYYRTQTYFDSDLGFVQEGWKNKHSINGYLNYTWAVNKSVIRYLQLENWWDVGNSLQGERRTRYFGGNANLRFTNRTFAGINYEYGYLGDYLDIYGIEYDVRYLALQGGTRNMSWGNVVLHFGGGEGYGYERYWNFYSETSVYPFSSFTVYSQMNWVKPQDEDWLWVVRLNLEHGITPDLLWRFIVDRDSGKQYRFAGLVGCTYLPGSTIYFAYNEMRDNSAGDFELTERLAQVKMSYQLSL